MGAYEFYEGLKAIERFSGVCGGRLFEAYCLQQGFRPSWGAYSHVVGSKADELRAWGGGYVSLEQPLIEVGVLPPHQKDGGGGMGFSDDVAVLPEGVDKPALHLPNPPPTPVKVFSLLQCLAREGGGDAAYGERDLHLPQELA